MYTSAPWIHIRNPFQLLFLEMDATDGESQIGWRAGYVTDLFGAYAALVGVQPRESVSGRDRPGGEIGRCLKK